MVQIVKHPCCGSIFAACHEPECYEDEDWQKTVRDDIKRGATVEMVNDADFKFGSCACPNKWHKPESNNQLTMF